MANSAADSGYYGWNFDRDNPPVQTFEEVDYVITKESEEVAYFGPNDTINGDDENEEGGTECSETNNDAATTLLRHERQQLEYDDDLTFIGDALEYLEIICDEKEDYDEEVERIEFMITKVMDAMDDIWNIDGDANTTTEELATLLHKYLRVDSRFQQYIADHDDQELTGLVDTRCEDDLKGTLQDKRTDWYPSDHRQTERAIFFNRRQKEQRKESAGRNRERRINNSE